MLGLSPVINGLGGGWQLSFWPSSSLGLLPTFYLGQCTRPSPGSVFLVLDFQAGSFYKKYKYISLYYQHRVDQDQV